MLYKIIQFSVKNKLIIGLMTFALILWGVYSATKLPLDVSGRPSTSCLSLIEFLALSQRKEYDKARRGTAFG